ncbi:MAG: NTP transferase domain-containing protein [Bacillota bacterium]|nr:NTP transferase domain-containing protein [Bacillota bacterium]
MNDRQHDFTQIAGLKAIVLAAGKGKRLQSETSDLPKVLRQAAGRALLDWVLDHIAFIEPADTILVVGFQADKVRQAVGPSYQYAVQQEQLGTGHAVSAATPLLKGYTGDVLVVYGDMPLLKIQTYYNLAMKHRRGGADCTMLTAVTAHIPDYGRILRDAEGRFAGIVEQRDCTPEQLLINEVNPGVYAFRAEPLFQALSRLGNKNAQGEYYLTDVPLIMRQMGCSIDTETIYDEDEILGVNKPDDLVRCENLLQEVRS